MNGMFDAISLGFVQLLKIRVTNIFVGLSFLILNMITWIVLELPTYFIEFSDGTFNLTEGYIKI